MVASIQALWMEAFPEDTIEDIKDFFRDVFPHEQTRCLVHCVNGKAVSMTFMLSAELIITTDGKRHILPMQYIYAAATLRKFRGQGIFGTLLLKAHDIARQENMAAMFLRPANDSLTAYYQKFGYQPYFYVDERTVPAGEFASADSSYDRDCGKRQGVDRHALLDEHTAFVRWPEYLVDYAVNSAQKRQGDAVCVDGGYALCEPFKDALWIREWLCKNDKDVQQRLQAAVATQFLSAQSTVSYRQPVTAGKTGTMFGMVCPLGPTAATLLQQPTTQLPYMGLAFD